ncbi:hypothetical protein VTI74DRAFT_10274 [Chaetomium olivicolor]
MDARSSRTPSAFEDSASIRSRAYYHPNPLLRTAESRYLLRDQFAMTRKEYEFGFDDASSILERSTLASEAHQEDESENTVTVGTECFLFFETGLVYRNCYELLCLPREASLSPDQVRDAAHRLVQVLAVDKQPPRLRGPAAFYLGLAQGAFQILVDPSRRLGYDLSEVGKSDSVCHVIFVDEDDSPALGSRNSYEGRLREQYLVLTQRGLRGSTDLGLRIHAAPGSSLQVLDFSLRKSATITLPALRQPAERAVLFLQSLGHKDGGCGCQARRSFQLTDPKLTITGSTHGLLDEPFKLTPLLLDRYQPPGPSIHARGRMEQLIASRFLPVLSLNLRQEFFFGEGCLSRNRIQILSPSRNWKYFPCHPR